MLVVTAGAPHDPAMLMLASEVADLLQVTPAWVYAETRRGRLPHIRLGRYVRYRRSAIDAWLDAAECCSRVSSAVAEAVG